MPVSRSGVQAAADTVLEMAIPWRSLAVSQEDQVQLIRGVDRGESKSIERLPHEGAIDTDGAFARLRNDDVASVERLSAVSC